MTLIDDIKSAERAANVAQGIGCKACSAIESMDPGETREALIAALAGTIGSRTLASILRSHDIAVGREAIDRHRKEGHR